MKYFLLFFLLILNSCSAVRLETEPSFLDRDELKLINLINVGRELTQNGRHELAEINFRKALELNRDLFTIYNDLAFSLHGQTRYEESIKYYLKALELNDKSFLTRFNLARVYFEIDDYYNSINELKKAEQIILSLKNKHLYLHNLNRIYRSLSNIYHIKGNYNDALCYSRMARSVENTFEQLVIHVRLLLATHNTRSASSLIESAINQGIITNNLLFDYVLVLVLREDFDLAKEISSRIMSETADFNIRRDLRLILVYLYSTEGEFDDMDFYFSRLLEDDPQLCKNIDTINRYGYWPYLIDKNVREVINEQCSK